MSRLPMRVQVALTFAATTAVLLAMLGLVLYRSMEGALEGQARARLAAQLTALDEVPPADRAAAVAAMTPPVFAQLLTPTGDVVAASAQVPVPMLSGRELRGTGTGGEDDVAVHLAGQREPEQAMVLVRSDGGRFLVVGTSREDLLDTLQTMLTTLLLGCLVALALAAALGYVVAGTALRPVDRMRVRAARISSDATGERLPVPATRDEIQRLGDTLNEMLDRLEHGLERERRFVAEAGHELRTPLALLRMEIDLALEGHRSEGELVEALRSAGEEVDRLTRLSADLLALRSGPTAEPVREPMDVSELLRTVASRALPAFRAAGRSLVVDVPHPVQVEGDRDRLDRALTNLLDNALRHGAGDVVLSARAAAGTVHVEVRDAGGGVEWPAGPLDPFTRAPGARIGAGNGLGLTIVRTIVDAHGGQVRLESTVSEGTVVTLDLPQAAPLT